MRKQPSIVSFIVIAVGSLMSSVQPLRAQGQHVRQVQNSTNAGGAGSESVSGGATPHNRAPVKTYIQTVLSELKRRARSIDRADVVQGPAINRTFNTRSSSATNGSYMVVHSFSGPDGSNLEGGLIQGSDGSFYGTAQSGGAYGLGTVFRMDASGNATVLHSFSGLEGHGPIAALVQGQDGNFYGTAIDGGSEQLGAVFRINEAGNVTVLHSFSGSDGAGPAAPLIQARDGYFYGTTALGGNLSCMVSTTETVQGCGTIFRIDSAGNFTLLYSFSGPDGLLPVAALLQSSDGNFYGTATGGGSATGGGTAFGTIFRMDSAGAVTVLDSFVAFPGSDPDGGILEAPVIQGSDGNFYGTTSGGGSSTSSGTVFKMDSSGNITVLHTFSGPDGAASVAPLIQASDGNFYGTTQRGGNLSCTGPNGQGCGTLFKMDSSGSVTVLNTFAGQPTDGSYPRAALVQGKNGILYGTAEYGGPANDGAIFQLSGVGTAPPKPSINAGGMASAANYATAVAPGSIAASFGSFLLSSPAQPQATPLPTDLSGLSMQFGGGTKAPLFYVSGTQVNLQVPWEVAGQSQVPVTVTVAGQTSTPYNANIVPFSPGIFAINSQGPGQGAILDASYRMVDASNAAMPGSTVLQIFCTGLGAVTNQPPTGFPAPTSPPLAETRTTPTVTIGGVSANVLFSGLAPGFVGEYQVNALVPASVLAGNAVPVAISIGGVTSNTVTIAVQGPTGTGTLNIQVTGLPAGTSANVSVTSTNGYATTVTASASLQVPSGTYSITASLVAAGNASYNATTQTANVAPGATANAQVAYDTVIPNTTKTLDPQGMQGLTVSTDGNTLTLPSASSAAQSLKPGDVLAVGITPATPRGLLRKVTSVSQSGSQIVAVTTQATLADAFQQLDFKFNAPFSLQDPPAGQALPPGVTFHRGKRPSGLARPAQSPTQTSCTEDAASWVQALSIPIIADDNGSITASGELDICTTLEVDFNITALPPTLNSLLVSATIAGDLHVGVSGEYQGSLKTQVPIMPTLQSDPIQVDVFGVPVVLTANVTFFVGAEGTVNGSFSAGADNEASVTLGLSYSGGQFSPIHTTTYKFTEDPLVFDASLMAKVYGGAKIDVTVDEVLTPSVSPDAFLQLGVDFSANPWWTLSGGVELSACSVALDIFGIGGELDCPDDLIQQLQLSFPIAQAPGGFLPSDTTPAITNITPGSVAAGSSGVTLTLTGTSFAPGATVNFNGAALQSVFVNTSQITAMLPAGDLTTGGTFPITVTNPGPNGGTSPPFNFKVQAANNPQPAITSLSPSSVPAGSSPLTLTINGSGFIASSTVTFNGVSHAARFVNSGQLTITLAASDLAAAGSLAVVVSNPAPGGGSSNAAAFTVQPAAVVPTLTSLTLSASTVVGGNSVMATAALSGPAPPGGVNITLESDNPAAVVPAPPKLPIAAGQSSATFTITTNAVASTQTITITASLGASFVTASLAISPANAGSPFQSNSFVINATWATSGQSIPVQISTSPPSPVQLFPAYVTGGSGSISLTMGFLNQEEASGNTATFNLGSGVYLAPGVDVDQPTDSTLTLTIQSPVAGAAATGTLDIVGFNELSPTFQGVNISGAITGTIYSVSTSP